MGQIYAKAKQVIIYLGENDPKLLSEAFEVINFLNMLNGGRGDTGIHGFTEYMSVMNYIEDHKWISLCRFLGMPWFERIWVVQEAAMAKRAQFSVGKHDITWDDFLIAMMTLGTSGSLRHKLGISPIGTVTGMETIRIITILKQRMKMSDDHILLDSLSLTRPLHKATDARDMVFGLLNFLGDSIQAVRADYSKTVEEVFQDIATDYLVTINDLRLLSYISIPEHKPIRKMPSWVPDWTVPCKPPFSYRCSRGTYKASGTTSMDLELLDGGVISLAGRVCDSIQSLTKVPIPDFSHLPGPLSPEEHKQFFEDRNGERIMEWKSLALSDPKTADYDKFLRTLVLDSPYGNRVATKSKLQHAADWMEIVEWKSGLTSRVPDHVVNRNNEKIEGIHSIENDIEALLNAKMFCITTKGRYGWVPTTSQEGDKIAILLGAEVPFVLRPVDEDHYHIHGECYVYGLMNGEGLTQSDSPEETVYLC